jgi:hypothetical protein
MRFEEERRGILSDIRHEKEVNGKKILLDGEKKKQKITG